MKRKAKTGITTSSKLIVGRPFVDKLTVKMNEGASQGAVSGMVAFNELTITATGTKECYEAAYKIWEFYRDKLRDQANEDGGAA